MNGLRLRVVSAKDRLRLAPLFAGTVGWEPPEQVIEGVTEILRAVHLEGDDALVRLTRRFDDRNYTRDRLRVEIPPLDEARGLVPEEIAAGFELAAARVRAFHERQRVDDIAYQDSDGTRYQFLTRPLGSVGAYVPGGNAPLPSTVIMTVVPAKLAGVQRVVVATPPSREAPSVHPAILFACALCGVDELYAVGGAQAIAALAYGTDTIARVDKIVGPGNVWVTEAKRRLFGTVGIDGLAGPSEVLVVADETSDPELVAGEMLAQAEHDQLARVAAIATQRAILEEVAERIEASAASDVEALDQITLEVLARRAFLIQADDEEELLDLIDWIAPEHLSVQTADPLRLAARVRSAGAIFLGSQTPVAAGDYIAGTNHVLPTSGAARFGSGLRLADFTRTFSVVENSAARMAADAPVLERLALFEGLRAHARTAR
ncbi:MAG: histidinol dehydrogenase, partial [Candidatus Eremiobacteraeota bacterium]|nr:histidinol dehydrogenase [Candidatus Eremiobacteraeota bacterium]